MADEDTVVAEPAIDEGDGVAENTGEEEAVDVQPEVVEEVEEDVDNLEVPVRSSAAHIIARQNRTIEKLRQRQEQGVDDDVEAEADPYQDDDSRPLTKADLKPLMDTLAGNADENELKGLFTDAPEAKRYEKRIRAYMNHPGWKAVPPQAIYHHLAFQEANKAAGVRKKAADMEAGQMTNAGGSARGGKVSTGGLPTAEEISDMSDEEFDKLQAKVNSGKFLAN